MALIVENGTGLSDAESYASVSDADDYFAKRGNTAWTALTLAEKEHSLRKAALNYMLPVFYGRWKGQRMSATQRMDFPRIGVIKDTHPVLSDEIPDELKWANAELAVRASQGELISDEERTVLSEKVGSLQVTYSEHGSKKKQYPGVVALLRPLLGHSGKDIRLVR